MSLEGQECSNTRIETQTHTHECADTIWKIYKLYTLVFLCLYAHTHTHTVLWHLGCQYLMSSKNFQGYYPHILRNGLNIITSKTSSSGDYLCDVQWKSQA